MIVKGVYLRSAWAKPTVKKVVAKVGGASTSTPVGTRPTYPSMDPQRMGAAPVASSVQAPGGAPAAPMPKPNWTASSSDGEGPPTKKARVAT